MSFNIVKGNLLEQHYDAIVVPCAPHLRLESYLEQQLLNECGDKLVLQLDQMKNPSISECLILDAYNLPCKKLIFVATPKWIDGEHDEEQLLKDSYTHVLELAKSFDLTSVAFPMLSSGANGFNKRKAIQIATRSISSFIKENEEMDAALVIFKQATWNNYKDLLSKYNVIDGSLNKDVADILKGRDREVGRMHWYTDDTSKILDGGVESKAFKDKLAYYIVAKGKTNAECYQNVISKTSFSKIMKGTIPEKYTVVALGINLELNIFEINDLLSPFGQRLEDYIEKDRVIISGILANKMLDEINIELCARGFVPLKTNESTRKIKM